VADPWSRERQFARLNRFGIVPHCEWYLKIYEFLSDEKRVSPRLEQLAAKASTAEAFKTALAKIETDNKFASPVEIIKLEYGNVFMDYVKTKRPVNDRGVPRETHGVLTHRIQWALCALEFAGALGGRISIADLYSGLANDHTAVPRDRAIDGSSISGGSDSIALWDVLVDSPYVNTNRTWRVCNGRSPEFLMAYLDTHPNAGIRQMHVFSENG
jgi:hypothetical protein